MKIERDAGRGDMQYIMWGEKSRLVPVLRKCEAGKKGRIAWLAIGSPPETPTNIVGSCQAGVLLILVYKARVKKNRKLVKDPQNVSRGR